MTSVWNGDEYGSLENSLKATEENAEYAGQPEILALVHVIERPITVHFEDSDKGTVSGEFFTYRPGIDILYYPEERDDKGELMKAGNYVLLRRATLLSQPLSQPENGKVYSLGDYVAVRSETNDWFMCVISEINDPSKEVRVRFMRKSGGGGGGGTSCQVKSWKSGSQSQQHFTNAPYHPLTIACVIPVMPSILRQVLFDIRAGNSNLAKSLSEKSNHAMHQDENPHRCLLSLQN